jgi:hypothetical protein
MTQAKGTDAHMVTLSIILAVAAAAALAAWMAEPSIPGPVDEQAVLQATTTQTASTSSAALDMGAGFAPGGLGLPAAGLVTVTAADRAQSDETYNFKLQESADNVTFTDISPNAAVPVNGAAATLGVVVCKGILKQRYVRLASTIAGTTPSVTFKAYLKTGRVG